MLHYAIFCVDIDRELEKYCDNNGDSAAVLMDPCKALNTINENLLLEKLHT